MSQKTQQEIELKLLVPLQGVSNLSQYLTDYHQKLYIEYQLINRYYDTKDGFFSAQKIGVRVRQQQDQFELTLKSAGHTQAGLHQRLEYNIPMQNAYPDFSLLAKFDELVTLTDWNELQQRVACIFETNFIRNAWLIELANGSEIEIALDQGKVIAQHKESVISEIEFELKQGNVNDLITFVEYFDFPVMRLGNRSKAQQGYYLSGLKQPHFDAEQLWQSAAMVSNESFKDKLSALLKYEQDLVEYLLELIEAKHSVENHSTIQHFLMHLQKVFDYYVSHTDLFTACFPHCDQSIVTELQELNQRALQQLMPILSSSEFDLVSIQHFLWQSYHVKRQLKCLRLLMQFNG